jgi:hypothetical protein
MDLRPLSGASVRGLILGLFLHMVPALLAAQGPVVWESSLGTAQMRARATGKPILMVVGQSSCQVCTTFKRGMLGAPGLSQALLETVPLDLQLDGDNGTFGPEKMKLAEAYGVKQVPAVFLLEADGMVIRYIGGQPQVKDLAHFIEGRSRPEAPKDPVQAQTTAPSSVPAPVPVAGLHFPEPKHSFGTVVGDLELKHRFMVANTGDAPRSIKEAKASCGCTTAVVGKTLLAPGEIGEIEAVFHTKGQRGKVAKTIQVSTDDPGNPLQVLILEAEIVLEVVMDPPELRFMDVQGKGIRAARARLKPGRNESLHLSEVAVQGAAFLTATYTQELSEAVVELRFDPTRVPLGQMAGVALVRVGTTDGKTQTFPVLWTLRQSISTQPARFYWNEPAGESYQGRVTLRQLAAHAFSILSAKASNPEFQIQVPLHKPAQAQEATVRVPKSVKPGEYNETITFTTDDPDQPIVVVPVRLSLRGKQG